MCIRDRSPPRSPRRRRPRRRRARTRPPSTTSAGVLSVGAAAVCPNSSPWFRRFASFLPQPCAVLLTRRAFRGGFSALFPTEYSVTAGQRQDDATEQHNSATVCSHGPPAGERGLNAYYHQRFRSSGTVFSESERPSWPTPAPPCHGRRRRLRGSMGGTMTLPDRKDVT